MILLRNFSHAISLKKFFFWEGLTCYQVKEKANTKMPSFPARMSFLSFKSEKEIIDKRRLGLEAYLQAVVADPALIVLPEVRNFLQYPSLESARPPAPLKLSSSFSSPVSLVLRVSHFIVV